MNDTPENDQDAPIDTPQQASVDKPDAHAIGRRVAEIQAQNGAPKFELFSGAKVTSLDGALVTHSRQALFVKLGEKPGRLFIPKSEILEGALIPNAHRTTDPEFGEAQHYDLQGAGQIYENAAWSFVEPPASLARVKNCVTFDLKCINLTQERPGREVGPSAEARVGDVLL